MSLRVVCCYSLLTGPDGWQDSHRCVRQFVNAPKSRPLSGYGYVRLFPDSPRLRIDGSNAHEAVDWFGAMAADILQRELPGTAPVLVPVPDSRRISTSPASLTRPLAEAISSRIAGSTVLDVLCFDQVMHSAHDAQGARDALSLHLHLKLRGPLLSGRPYVLVDDVVTTGGHLAAARALLRQHGAEALMAVCAASADRTPAIDPFERVVRTIVDYVPRSADVSPLCSPSLKGSNV